MFEELCFPWFLASYWKAYPTTTNYFLMQNSFALIMNINIFKLTTCKITTTKNNANNEKKRLTDKEILLEFSQIKDWFSAKSVIATSICEIMNR